ncbi:hypothetical protein VNI00_002149 [Paramarasmius palmivorus]|uniref:NAD(P)-binding protein n=1 Tax=Paramarasmius palmivorus TaxID=297713 RepID=A0AAW0E268_9AGAR
MSSLQATHAQIPFSRPATPGGSPQQVGFVGIGAMGYFMARNLATRRAQAGQVPNPPVIIWNRTPEKSAKLAAELGPDRIRIAETLEEVATECDIIISCLANDTIVKNIYQDFAKALTDLPPVKNKIFVESSTIYPSLAGELDTMLSAIPHTHLITCPVFGTPAVADQANLLIIMAGDYRSKKEVAHLLVPAVGRKVIDLGENLEKAPTFKLIGNSVILGQLEILGEAFTLGEKAGIGGNLVNQLIKEIVPAPGTIAYADRMANDNFDGSVGFAINGGIKDASHIRRLTAELNAPMPAIDIAHQHLITARALHTAQKNEGKKVVDTLDWSGIVAGSRVAAGLDGFDSKKHLQNVQLELDD